VDAAPHFGDYLCYVRSMLHDRLIWLLGGLIALSALVWLLVGESRSRIKYTWFLICGAILLALVPHPQSWMREVAVALAELAALHLLTVLFFRFILRRLELPVIISDFAVIAVYAVVLLSLLAHLGVNLAGLIATSAVAAAVIGLALQDFLSNLIGGVSIQTDGLIRPGVWIKSDQGSGRVLQVRLRCTTLQTLEGDTLLIPNHSLTRSAVTIFGASSRKLVRFRLGAQHPPATVIRIVEEALTASPIEGVAIDPPPTCVVLEHQPQHIEYGVYVWITISARDERPASEALNRIYFALGRANAPVGAISTALELHRPAAAPTDDTGLDAELDALKRMPIWGSLTEDELNVLARRLKRLWFAPGESVVKEGEAGSSMFVILRGTADVRLTKVPIDPQPVATLGAGDFFGEMSLLTGDKRSASVIATDILECGKLEKEDVSELLIRRPDLAAEISAILEQRKSALELVREKMPTSGGDTQTDLFRRIQEFFGLGKSRPNIPG
jgi:small-conductance mechanosensitive channel/CRP-like cAMP-binding protein